MRAAATASSKVQEQHWPSMVVNLNANTGIQMQSAGVVTNSAGVTLAGVGYGMIGTMGGSVNSSGVAYALPVGVATVASMVRDLMAAPVPTTPHPVPPAGAPENDYDSEVIDELVRLAKEPAAAVFDTPEELMGWLDDPQK
jgi:hypothetical protein